MENNSGIIINNETYDHLKINIEQSSKGSRVTVTYDRSDHNIDEAVLKAVEMYKKTLETLRTQGLKIDGE
jgi:hypothetical protein